jgi:CheY-like chemotaxis protein
MAKKILVVDDEPDITMMLKMRLDSRNYNTITAQDGQEALDKVEKEMPDLLILDIMMPKMNGYELFHVLRASPKYSHIPIIILTASVEIDYVKRFIKEGADAYLKKPYKAETLLGIVNGLLGE